MWRRATQRARASKRWRSSVVNCIEVVGYGRGDIILIIVRYACARSTPSGAVHRTRGPDRPVRSRVGGPGPAGRGALIEEPGVPSFSSAAFFYVSAIVLSTRPKRGHSDPPVIIRSDPRTGYAARRSRPRGARARPHAHPARYPHAAGAPTTPTAPTRSLAGCAPTSRPVRDRPPRVQAASYRAIGTLLRTRQT